MFKGVWPLLLCGLAVLSGSVGAEPMYDWQWTIAPGTFPANQAPTVAALPDGILLVCWPAGSAELASDVQIYCCRSSAGARGWEQPTAVVRPGERAQGSWLKTATLGNPVLFFDRERYLWLFYAAVDVTSGWSGSHVDYKVSGDMGRTWGTARRLVANWGNLPKNKVLVLGSDGPVLLPVYHELFGTHGYVLQLVINGGAIRSVESRRIPGGDHIQPALVWAEPKRIVAYLRSTSRSVPHVLRSEYDLARGRWSKPEALEVPNPRSAVDVVNTEDGGILLAYNASPTVRTPLSLAYSRDSWHFTKIWDFESEPGRRFSYPVLIRAADGVYHMVYRYHERGESAAIKHVTFNHEWLTLRIRAAASR